MGVIYTIGIVLFGFGARVKGLFVEQARRWVLGRRDIFARLEEAFRGLDRSKHPVVWFHVSSLGEFEQGRPVMEELKVRRPATKILLTFFSPSGYEVRKDYAGADYIFYLPLDTPSNANRFLEIVQPETAFFVKYDYWFNFMDALHRRGIPLYVVAALFRPGQYFFKPWAGWFRRRLARVSCFFVQNEKSGELLSSAGITGWRLAGDTRFDRVAAIATKGERLPLIEEFAGDRPLFVAGSSWPPDEEIFFPMIRSGGFRMKFIIAPHDASPERVADIRRRLGVPSVTLSELTAGHSSAPTDVLIIDSVGILSKIYRYATVAFIGGGFGKSIHNIQEPVTFGVPVFFGPNFRSFPEAVDLVGLGGAFPVDSSAEFVEQVGLIMTDSVLHRKISDTCRGYVAANSGATGVILDYLLKV